MTDSPINLSKTCKMTMVWYWMAAASDVKECHLSLSFTLPDSLSLSLSPSSKWWKDLMRVRGRWSAVSCCHWPRTRRICRDRQYARAGQKLIPLIIKAREKSTEDVALLRRGEKKNTHLTWSKILSVQVFSGATLSSIS